MVDVWTTPGPYYTLNFETPVVIHDNIEKILVEVYQLPSSNSESHLFCSGTAEDNDVSWFKTGMAGCTPQTYKTTEELGYSDARFYITVSGETATAGLIDVSSKSTSIYPNPTTGVISLKSKYSLISYEIINSLGQTIAHGDLQSNNISLSDLETGIYMLYIKTVSGKIIKKRVIKV